MKPTYCVKLRELRLENHYTQSELALILDIRQEQYSKYESGVRLLPINLLVKLCTLYRVSSDTVLGIKK